MRYKAEWERFKEGFVSVWRLLYPEEPDGIDWYAQIGRIFGALTLVGLWKVVADILIWIVT
jgi:hypothetical protein